MNRDYERTTRESAVADLRAELGDAIRRLVQEQLLGDIEREQLVCVETKNERLKKGGVLGALTGTNDPDTQHYTAAIVTPLWIIWAIAGAKRGTTAFCARLDDVEIRDYDLQKLIEDDGITITAVLRQLRDSSSPLAQFASTHASVERASAFLGLGPGAATAKFRAVLREAIRKINSNP